jgi:hypothetical protein
VPLAGLLDDLHGVDPNAAIMEWVSFSSATDGVRAEARQNHGFTSVGGLLYVHGGIGYSQIGQYGTLSITSN